jgi:hypothetical protein
MKSQGQVSIVTISCVAAKEPGKGHPFWFHNSLSRAARNLDVDYSTVGAMDQENEEILGALSHSGFERPASSVFAPWKMRADVSRIVALLRSKPQPILHFYEGGFREFVLALFLLEQVQNSVALFNFNLTDPWQKVFAGQSIWSEIARHRVLGHLKVLGGRLIPFAETFETSKYFSTAIGAEFTQYPLFSSIQLEREGENLHKVRKYDVAFFPGDEAEFELVASSIEILAESGNSVSAVAVPRWGYALSAESQLRAAALGMVVRSDMLDAKEYGRLYLDSKLAVFPYIGEYYRHTSSGRLLDAAHAGCYSLAPRDSLAGNQAVREGWGESFQVGSLSESILRALTDWENYKIRAAPSPEATIEILAEAGLRALSLLPSSRRARRSKYLTFYAIFLGSGFRSWAPRLLQGIQNLRVVSRNR